MADKFKGFTDEFFAFFTELSKNNNREWFQANKPHYQQVVLGQLSSFVEAIQPRLDKISEHIVADPRPVGGSIFRIYRDLRFAKGGNPYKEHGACHFRHAAGKDAHAPGFYVHMEPTKVIFGGGVWVPPYFFARSVDSQMERIYNIICEFIRDGSSEDRQYRRRFSLAGY